MKSHELARLLLTLPNLPIATSAHGCVYSEEMSARSHGPLTIGVMSSYAGDHIVIGDMVELINNGANWRTKEVLVNGH